jgi:hypothetical protein
MAMERTPTKTILDDKKSTSPLADAFRSVGAAITRLGTTTRQASKRQDLPVPIVAVQEFSTLSEHGSTTVDPDVDNDAAEEALLQQLEEDRCQRVKDVRRARIVQLQTEAAAAEAAATVAAQVEEEEEIESVTSMPLPMTSSKSMEVRASTAPTTSLPTTFSNSRGRSLNGGSAGSAKNITRPSKSVTTTSARSALVLTNITRLQRENDSLRMEATANAQQFATLQQRLDLLEQQALVPATLADRMVLPSVPPTGVVRQQSGKTHSRSIPAAKTHDGGNDDDDDDDDDVVDDAGDDHGEEEPDDDGDDGDDFSADTHAASDTRGRLQRQTGLTKVAAAEAAALAANAARADRLTKDFKNVTARGNRVTIPMLVRVLYDNVGGGLVRTTAVGSVIVQTIDNSNRKGMVVRLVTVLRGNDGAPVGESTGLASADHTVVFPLSMDEIRLMFLQEISALTHSAEGSPLSSATRLERIHSIQAFELLLMPYLRSQFGPFSPHAGSRKNNQWGDWIEAMITMWMFWNINMLAPAVTGEKSLGGLVSGFNQAFNNSGSQALSSAFGGKTNPQTLMVDILKVLAVCCMVCYSKEASENLCLACHNSGKCPFPGGFHTSADARGEDAPDDKDFTLFCKDPAMVAQYQLTRSSIKQKMVAYRAAYPGKPIHMHKAPAGKVVQLSRDVFLAMLKDKQGYIIQRNFYFVGHLGVFSNQCRGLPQRL